MHGIDTNMLVRFLTRDDAAQAKKVASFFTRHCSPANPGWVNVIVLCETVWALTTAYKYDKAQVILVVEGLLKAPFLQIEDDNLVRSALRNWEAAKFDFSDALIAERNRRAGCDTTYSFDRRAIATAGFSALPKD